MTPRLLLLTAHPELHAPRRLAEAARALGLAPEIALPHRWWERGRADRSLHAAQDGAWLIARPGPFTLVDILRMQQRLERAGARALQTRRALADACDQWRTLQRCAAAGLATPRTVLVRAPCELEAALDATAGAAWFVKGRRGSQGSHVLFAESRKRARAAATLLWGSGGAPLVQADARALGPVERHLVAGDVTLASAVAHPAPGEVRSNAHRGGRFEPCAPGRAAGSDLARRAVAALGLPFAAVDTIGDGRSGGPLLLEVNASPGLEALEAATGRDLAGELLARILAAPRPRRGATARELEAAAACCQAQRRSAPHGIEAAQAAPAAGRRATTDRPGTDPAASRRSSGLRSPSRKV